MTHSFKHGDHSDDDDDDKATRKKLARALALLHQDPQNAALIRDVSDLHAQLGEIQEAKDLLTAAITDRIAVKELSFHLGVICLSVGDVDEAVILFEQLKNTGLDVPELFYNLAYAYLLQQKPDRVITLLMPLAPNFTALPDTALLLSRALYWKGNLADALTYAALAEHLLPKQAEPLALLAILSFEVGDLKAAQHWASSALEIETDQVDAFNALGSIAFKEKRFDDAMTHYQEAIQSVPFHPRAHLGLGLLALKAQDLDSAAHHFETALEADPHHLGLHLASIWTYILKAEWEKASDGVLDALYFQEECPHALAAMALIAWITGDDQASTQNLECANLITGSVFADKLLLRLQKESPNVSDRPAAFQQLIQQTDLQATFLEFLSECLKRHLSLKPVYH